MVDIARLDTNGRSGKDGHCRTGHCRTGFYNVHPCQTGPSLSSTAMSTLAAHSVRLCPVLQIQRPQHVYNELFKILCPSAHLFRNCRVSHASDGCGSSLLASDSPTSTRPVAIPSDVADAAVSTFLPPSSAAADAAEAAAAPCCSRGSSLRVAVRMRVALAWRSAAEIGLVSHVHVHVPLLLLLQPQQSVSGRRTGGAILVLFEDTSRFSARRAQVVSMLCGTSKQIAKSWCQCHPRNRPLHKKLHK